MKIYIGIDPGNASGGITILTPEFSEVGYCIRFKDKTNKELCEEFLTLKELVISSKQLHVVLEEVHAFPLQGVVAAGKFMENYGMLKGFLIALNIPFRTVRPQVWQKFYSMHREKTESIPQWKRRLRQRAQELYPELKITNETADATLIAHYCLNND